VNAVDRSILPGSPASGTGTIIAPGDVLRRINGHVIGDVLDYRYATRTTNALLSSLSALAAGAVRVLRDEEEVKTYTGVPVWNGFAF